MKRAILGMSLAAIPAGIMLASGASATGVQPVSAGQPATNAQPAEQGKAARKPKLVVAAFHADWCGKCKALEPSMKELMEEFAGKGVLFVSLDQTDPEKTAQAELLASEIGLGDEWADYGRKTGFAVLVNPETDKVVGMLRSDRSLEDLRRTIADQL